MDAQRAGGGRDPAHTPVYGEPTLRNQGSSRLKGQGLVGWTCREGALGLRRGRRCACAPRPVCAPSEVVRRQERGRAVRVVVFCTPIIAERNRRIELELFRNLVVAPRNTARRVLVASQPEGRVRVLVVTGLDGS